jgi:4-amino-4-deoxy-L-arabinose transferase-like glycosyltransferase
MERAFSRPAFGTPLALTSGRMEERARIADAVLLSLFLALLLAWPLLSPPIGHHGEAREGLVVQDVVRHGHWLLPRRNGELPSKPPLFHWVAATTTRAFGAGDASLRLASSLAAIVVLLATYGLGAVIGGRRAAWLAGAILLGMAPFLQAAVEARVDMVFTAAITVALVGFALWDWRGAAAGRVLCWAGMAAAVLAKGPAGFVVPAAVIVAFLALDRRLAVLRRLCAWPFLLALLAIDGGWYALAARDGGTALLHLQLVHENLERIAGDPSFHHSGHHHAARLPLALLGGLLPWSVGLVWSGVARVRGGCMDHVARFLHAWWITVLVLFSLSAGQRPVYLLPAVPAVALIAARLVDGFFGADPVVNRRLAATLVVFDLAALIVFQSVRLHRAEKVSLAAFGDAVGRSVPADAPLDAAPTLGREEVMVIAYRSARAIPRADPRSAPAAYHLVPAADATASGATVIVASDRQRGPNVALVHATP